MRINLDNLTPAEEIIILGWKSSFKIKDLIKYSFYNLIVKSFISLEVQKDFFTVCKNVGSLNSGLPIHEQKIYDLIPEQSISLENIIDQLSNFEGAIFRSSSKSFKFENYVFSELVKKQLLYHKKKRLLGFIEVKRMQETDELYLLKNKIEKIIGSDGIPNKYKYLSEKYILDKSQITESLLLRLDEYFSSIYDKYYQQKNFAATPISFFEFSANKYKAEKEEQ